MDIAKFINDQLSRWPLACENFRALKNISIREMETGGLKVILQHNPARIVSSAAKLDRKSLAGRKCFLCRENRPPEQICLEFEGRKGKKYDILVNPYPILRDHLVIAMREHCDQSIWRRYVDMLDLAAALKDFTVFYNGPQSGASAPDHHHFQAASNGQLPLISDMDGLMDGDGGAVLTYLTSVLDAGLYHYRKFVPGIFVIRGTTSKSVAKMFYRLLDCAGYDRETQPEPLVNVFVWHKGGEFRSAVVFRTSHRSHHYFSTGEDHLTMSPGCADMAGCIVAPLEEDFRKMNPSLLTELMREVSLDRGSEERIISRLTRTQREVSVGIMSGKEIVFEILSDGAGPRKAVFCDGKIEYDGSEYDELFFEARTLSTMFAEPTFRLYGVTVGIGFHWERRQDRMFAGALKIIPDRDCLVAVNVIGMEDYLVSVISSEMNPHSPEEFLKAHAVISRSWLLSMISGYQSGEEKPAMPAEHSADTGKCGADEYVRWYGREEHTLFDVCADDHCQRYQGLVGNLEEAAKKAVDETWGQILTYGGEICDTRFSKCCGGVTEKFSSCWEDRDYGYLRGISDTVPEKETCLSGEKAFREELENPDPGCFCGNADVEILDRVMKSYDRETGSGFRWQVSYGREELSRLFAERSGIDAGEIQALVPVERGVSGRLVRLEVIGSARRVVIGKELEIRRVLSESHLKSSAFAVDYTDGEGNSLDAAAIAAEASAGKRTSFERIVLSGAGWGHGVGLCQIGAAVMASSGYSWRDILAHYYPGSLPDFRAEV